ncbi:MAG: AraC family transcriptional regulator [Oscillospiraceae bacterium]
MREIFFEDIHKASCDYPYLDFNMNNINFLSHFHEEIEIVFVKTGIVKIISGESEILAKNGDICIFMPGEIHSFLSSENNRVYIIKIITKSTIENIDFALLRLEHNIISKNDENYDTLFNIIKTLKYESENKISGYEFAINSLINKILLTVVRQLKYVFINVDEKKKLINRLVFLKNVNTYIEENFQNPISLDEVAEYCHYSKYYFSHYFKETTNSVFIDFLTSYRLEKSLPLIRFSNEKITNIALNCGFSNVRSFNRAFVKHYKSTPSNFRKSNIK